MEISRQVIQPTRTLRAYVHVPPTLPAPLCFGPGLWSGCRRLTRGACVCQLAIIQLLDAPNYLQNIARYERERWLKKDGGITYLKNHTVSKSWRIIEIWEYQELIEKLITNKLRIITANVFFSNKWCRFFTEINLGEFMWARVYASSVYLFMLYLADTHMCEKFIIWWQSHTARG